MPLVRIAARMERVSEALGGKMLPVAQVPPRVRALVLQAAVAVLLLAAGIVIGHTLAWVLIGVAVTVIVIFGAAGFVARQPRQVATGAASPPGASEEAASP